MTGRQVSFPRFHRRDWDKVRQFLLGEGEAPERLPRILAAEDTVAWLAVDGRDVVGWTLTYPLLAEDRVERGGVENLVVARSHRRRGIGRRLLELAEAYYRRKDLAGMQLTVRADNQPARRLYEAMGYQIVQQRLRMWKQFDQ